MQLKKIVQIMLVSCSILALSSCSSGKKHGAGDSAMLEGSGSGGGAETSGIGDSDKFGGQGGMGSSGQSITKRTYYFDYDSSDIHEDDMPAIYANADNLVAHPNMRIILEGHTDPRGSREYNVALGERRANTVMAVLKSRGVNPNQIRVVSYGAEQLAAPGRSEQDFQLDRRVVIAYTQN